MCVCEELGSETKGLVGRRVKAREGEGEGEGEENSERERWAGAGWVAVWLLGEMPRKADYTQQPMSIFRALPAQNGMA